MVKCKTRLLRHWTAQIMCAYAFAATACFPQPEEHFQRENALKRQRLKQCCLCSAAGRKRGFTAGGAMRAKFRSKDSIFLHCKEDTIISCGKTIVHWAFQTKPSLFKEPAFQLSEIRNKYFRRLCYGIWLFYLHSALKIQPFSPVFPLAGSTAEAFFRLSLWSFKEKSINHF